MKTRYTLAAIALAASLAAGAQAQDTPNLGQDQAQGPQAPAGLAPELSFNVGVASDYVFRGVSQTENDGHIYAGADFGAGAFYAGVWASTVEFAGDEDTIAEVDLYGGWRPDIGGFALDLGALYYAYPGQPSGAEYDYFELKAAASRSIGPVTGGLAAYWTPEYFAKAGDAFYAEANAAVEVGPGASITGAIGRQDIEAGGDYTTWNLGLAVALTDTITLDSRYWDTDADELGDIYDGRVVFGLKAAF